MERKLFIKAAGAGSLAALAKGSGTPLEAEEIAGELLEQEDAAVLTVRPGDVLILDFDRTETFAAEVMEDVAKELKARLGVSDVYFSHGLRDVRVLRPEGREAGG